MDTNKYTLERNRQELTEINRHGETGKGDGQKLKEMTETGEKWKETNRNEEKWKAMDKTLLKWIETNRSGWT